MLLGWSGDRPLADPMCGSASFLLEAALIARQQAPGLNRQFAFMQWPGYREGVWRLLCDAAARAQIDSPLVLHGADQDQEAVASAKTNCGYCGLDEMIVIESRSLADQPMHQGHGLLVSNPPYGKRLSLNNDPMGFYQDLGTHIGRAYPNWDVALLCPDPDLVRATGLPFRRVATLDNGGLRVGLFRAKLC